MVRPRTQDMADMCAAIQSGRPRAVSFSGWLVTSAVKRPAARISLGADDVSKLDSRRVTLADSDVCRVFGVLPDGSHKGPLEALGAKLIDFPHFLNGAN